MGVADLSGELTSIIGTKGVNLKCISFHQWRVVSKADYICPRLASGGSRN